MRKIMLLSIIFLAGCAKAPVNQVVAQAVAPTPAPVAIVDFPQPSKNRVLNGAMKFDQVHQGVSYIAPRFMEMYSLDQWRICGGGDGVWEAMRAPVDVDGHYFGLQITVIKTRATETATDNHHIEYPIESRYMKDFLFGSLDAKPITLSFWVKASKPGLKPFALMNGSNSRSLVTSYSVDAANTWQKIVISFPGDQIGNWPTADWLFGMKLLWSLGVGANFTRSDDLTWAPAASWNKDGTDQFIDEPVGSVLQITKVQLEVGASATDFDEIDQSEELTRLQRYLYVDPNGFVTDHRMGGS